MCSHEQPNLPTSEFTEWWPQFLGGSPDWVSGELQKVPTVDGIEKSGVLLGLPVLPYHCVICKRGTITATDLSSCASCKCVRYCTKGSCQKIHWKGGHKKACKVMKSMADNVVNTNPTNIEEFYSASFAQYMMAVKSGQLDGIRDETDNRFLIRPHCFNCCASGVKLTECRVCHGVAYCDKDVCKDDTTFAQLHPRDSCEKNSLILAAWVMKMQQGGVPLRVPSQSRSNQLLPDNWAGYFAVKQGDFKVPKALLQMPPVTALLTSTTTTVLTVIHILQTMIPDSMEMSYMKVHFLNAKTMNHMGSGQIYEEFFHWFPQLRLLDILLVGPEVTTTPVEEFIATGTRLPGCDACRALGCRVRVCSEQMKYHESSAAQDLTVPITLVLAQNSGLHKQITQHVKPDATESYHDSWTPTLQLLALNKIPCVFTSYNDFEAEEDAKTLKKIMSNVEVAMNVSTPKRNPFRSLMPCIEPTNPNKFFYDSDYLIFCA